MCGVRDNILVNGALAMGKSFRNKYPESLKKNTPGDALCAFCDEFNMERRITRDLSR
jgi:hypothetical protein